MKPLLTRRPAANAFPAAFHARRSSAYRARVRVVAFQERNAVKDWRVKQMVDTCHTYYSSLWNRGHLTAAFELLDPSVVLRDLCNIGSWGLAPHAAANNNNSHGNGNGNNSINSNYYNGSNSNTSGSGSLGPIPATGLIVGPKAIQSLVSEVRAEYPDFHLEVEDLAVGDSHRIFAAWTARGTHMDSLPRQPAATSPAAKQSGPQTAGTPRTRAQASSFPSTSTSTSTAAAAAAASAAPSSPAHAASSGAGLLIRGVDVLTFNQDRSRILEITVYRQLSGEERREVGWRLSPRPLEIRLARLHRE